jgi:hypothetical protein
MYAAKATREAWKLDNSKQIWKYGIRIPLTQVRKPKTKKRMPMIVSG